MLKYLLLILFIVLVIWLTRLLRPHDSPRAAGRKAAAGRADPEAERVMLACAYCGLHLPRSDALPGRGGVYCGEAHRAIAEARDGSD